MFISENVIMSSFVDNYIIFNIWDMCTFRLSKLHHWISNIMLYAVVIWHFLIWSYLRQNDRQNLFYLRLKFKAQYRTHTDICTSPFKLEKSSFYIFTALFLNITLGTFTLTAVFLNILESHLPYISWFDYVT